MDKELLGAIARGWCHKENENKVMDVDLANAIAEEVNCYLATNKAMNDEKIEKFPHQVVKAWGKEIWLYLCDKYCYKRIYINAGHRTSLQYHKKKLETNYIISGEAKVLLGNVWHNMKADDFFTVQPGIHHRIYAVTDLVLQEVSTPEVSDVIRIEDDTNRPDGRIESEHSAMHSGGWQG